MSVAIQVQQALHGYHEGHTLLASSIEVPRASRAIMQFLSDRSGPGDEPGFDSYLTGYPLPELDSYAFARTWMAPEMPRPGCVWTHSLLIAFRDLAALPALEPLGVLFRRPKMSELGGQDPYRHPITLKVAPRGLALPSQLPSAARAVVTELYATAQPVFLEANASSESEGLILSLWAQQWPSLRRAFTFCSGALTPREIDNRSFDLQVVPQARWGRVRRAVPGASFVSREAENDTSDAFPWAEVALSDLASSDPTAEMRTFLRTFGADMGASRPRFPLLVEAFLLLSGPSEPPEATLSGIGTLFPGANEAKRLKAALLGVPRPLLRSMPVLAAVFGVYRLTDPLPYSAPGIADAARLRELWEDDVQTREAILRHWQESLNAFGVAAISDLIRAVPPGELVSALAKQPESIRTVIAMRPEVLSAEPYWEMQAALVRAGIDAVLSSRGARWEAWEDAVRVGLDSPSADVLLDYDPLREALAAVLLNDALAEPVRLAQPLTVRAVSRVPVAAWAWIGSADASLAFLADLLLKVPAVVHAALAAPEAALSLARRAARASVSTAEADIIVACILSVALPSRAVHSREIIEVCFERVHNALHAGRLPTAGVDILNRSLFPGRPAVSADTLRRQLVQRYEAEKWGWAPLLRSVAGASVVEQLLRLFAPEPPPKRGDGRK